jgi:hypothetical protein
MYIFSFYFISRPCTAPSSSIFAPKYQSWTPTTPTPCSALRPSLSLHNLESKSFTEVLVPSIKPPTIYQVTPSHSVSKRSPLIISPARTQKKLSVVVFGGKASISSQSIPAVPEQIWTNNESPRPTKTPSPSSPNLQSCASLPSLVEISENIPFMECKKEISV